MIDAIRLERFVDQCLSEFDPEDQLDILEEECAELIKACSKFKRAGEKVEAIQARKNIIEEMSHVLISSAVVARIYNVESADIIDEINKKADKYGFDQVK